MSEYLNKEIEQRSEGIRVASRAIPNPLADGNIFDAAEARSLMGGKGALLVIVDSDENPRHESSEVLAKITQSVEGLISVPSMKEGMKIISSALTRSDSLISVGLIATHPDTGKRVILSGTTGLNPSLLAIDSITDKIVNQKPEQTMRFLGVNYGVWDLNPDRVYFLLGTGITENLDNQELQAVIKRAVGSGKENGERVELSDLVEYIALKVRQKIHSEKGTANHKRSKVFANDITIAAIETPGEIAPAALNPEKNGFVDFAKKFFNGEFSREVVFSNSLGELSRTLVGALPESERLIMIQRLKTLSPQTESIELLNALLSNTDSADIGNRMEYRKIDVKHLGELLDKSVIWDMVSVMLDHKKEFQTPLAILLAEVPLGAIPARVREKLGDVPHSLDMEVLPWFENWYLCDMFGGRLNKALRKTGVIFVNGIPIKFLGKPAGVMLETITDDKGEETILEGTIVSPIDKAQREMIKQQFDAGVPSIEIPGLKLAVMRTWTKTTDGKDWADVGKRLREYRAKLPKRFPPNIGKLTRQQWRLRNREEL